MRKIILFFSIFILALSLTYKTTAQTAEPNIKTAENAAEKLRELYKMRDFEAGYESGRKFIKQFPENSELRAWFISNTARNYMSAEAVETAKRFTAENPEDAWAWFALVNAHIGNSKHVGDSPKDALFAAEKLLRTNDEQDEFIFAYANALLINRKFDELQRFLGKIYPKIKDKTRFYVTKGETFYNQSYLQNAEEKYGANYQERFRQTAFDNFEKALKISPESVSANYIYGLRLNWSQKFDKALPVLEKASELSPDAPEIKRELWKAVYFGQDEKAKNKILDEAEKFIALKSDSLNALVTVAQFYGDIKKPEKIYAVAGHILTKFPQSEAAEGALYDAIRMFDYFPGHDFDESKAEQLTKMLRSFQNRLKHYNQNFLGDSYVKLFSLIKDDKNVSDQELLEIAEKIRRLQTEDFVDNSTMIADALTERKLFDEAEKFINVGFERFDEDVKAQREYIGDEFVLERNSENMKARLHTTKGWIFFKSERVAEAEKELEKALEFNETSVFALNKLGQIYEAQNRFDEAEKSFIRGFAAYPAPENVNKKSLESLYEKRVGNSDKIDDYFKKIEKTVREIRREQIINSKLEKPRDFSPFTLKNLKAETVSSADFKGKIVVVNIWGAWCSPCVAEMPDFQKLHEKYADDEDVAILTINNDAKSDTVKKFMNDKKYDFAVLRDENYLDKVGVNIFPTTWFIGKDGKISYIALGSTTQLLDEFSWRIEALK